MNEKRSEFLTFNSISINSIEPVIVTRLHKNMDAKIGWYRAVQSLENLFSTAFTLNMEWIMTFNLTDAAIVT